MELRGTYTVARHKDKRLNVLLLYDLDGEMIAVFTAGVSERRAINLARKLTLNAYDTCREGSENELTVLAEQEQAAKEG